MPLETDPPLKLPSLKFGVPRDLLLCCLHCCSPRWTAAIVTSSPRPPAAALPALDLPALDYYTLQRRCSSASRPLLPLHAFYCSVGGPAVRLSCCLPCVDSASPAGQLLVAILDPWYLFILGVKVPSVTVGVLGMVCLHGIHCMIFLFIYKVSSFICPKTCQSAVYRCEARPWFQTLIVSTRFSLHLRGFPMY